MPPGFPATSVLDPARAVAHDEPPSLGHPTLQHRLPSIGPAGRAWGVFLGGLVASFLLYGVPILGRFSTSFVGQGGADAKLYVWDLAWWPHAIAAGLDPFHPTVLWAPSGVNMAWVTGLPGPSLAIWPITSVFGAVVSSNVIAILSPALATWAAYLLCREVTDRFWPAVAGGILFGFSTYQIAEMRGHVNLFLVFPVPLAAYLVLRFIHGRLSRRVFVLLLAAVLVTEFSISTEVFATMTMFAVFATVGAYTLAPATRPMLRAAFAPTLLAFVLAAVVLAPYLWYAAAGLPAGPLRPVGGSSTDLLSFFIPRDGTLLGGSAFAAFTHGFPTNVSEDGAYLGPVLIGVTIVALMAGRRQRVTWLLAGLVALAAVLSMGTILYVGRERTITLPWAALSRLPLVGDAQPDRLTMYMWLGVAVIVARWLSGSASAGRSGWTSARWGAVAIAAVMLIPNVHEAGLHRPIRTPRFFAEGIFRRVIAPGETVLLVHDRRDRGEEMLWQEQAGFSFSMPQGHTGPEPAAFAADQLWHGVQTGRLGDTTAGQLRSWLRQHGVGAVVVTPGSLRMWTPILDDATGVHPKRLGGVLLYRPLDGATSFA